MIKEFAFGLANRHHFGDVHDIEFNIYPLMDYLRTDQIKQLYEWLYDTYKEMNEDAVNNVGIEYLLVVKKYLDSITTRVGTAYTQ